MTTGVPPLVDRLFREESGRLTALLTRLLGPAQLALVEDVVQEAFIAALGHWPRLGVPDAPAAWLLQVARRKALDALHPIGHVGEPNDIAYGILYLASDESKFVTGSELVIDGGYTAQ